MAVTDKAKFKAYLQDKAASQGKRCGAARNSDNGDIIAAAIAMSTLRHLHHAARAKVLSYHDLDVVLDAFLEGSEMKETFDAMGALIYQRAE